MAEETTMPPAVIIGIIVAVGFILLIVPLGLKVLGLFDVVVDEGSINNYNVLTKYTESLVEDDRVFINNFKQPLPFYLVDGVILVGYNYNEDKQHTDCSKEDATRPVQLLGKAGLCLHVEDNANNFDEDKRDPIQCYPFDGKVIFLAPSDRSYQGGFGGRSKAMNVYGASEQYEDLFLYGSECDLGAPDLGATRLYIEKYKKGDEIYIYLEEYREENKNRIKERIDRIDGLIKTSAT